MAIKMTRRQALKAGAAGLALTSPIGIAPKFIRPARAAGLAPGMTGGPPVSRGRSAISITRRCPKAALSRECAS